MPHGWATAPTSSLTFYGAGVQVTGPAEKSWLIQPRLGGMKRVTAGYETPLGQFSANLWTISHASYLLGLSSLSQNCLVSSSRVLVDQPRVYVKYSPR